MNKAGASLIAAFLLSLNPAPAVAQTSCSFQADLRVGARGASVSCLQVALLEQGYVIPAGPTGYFGAQTRTAVASWQRDHGIAPSAGYFGPLSRKTYASVPATASAPPGAPVAYQAPAIAAALPPPSPVAAAAPQFSGGSSGGSAAPAPSPVIAPAPNVPAAAPASSVPAPTAPVVIAEPSNPVTTAFSEITGTLTSGTVDAPAPVLPRGEVKWSCDFEDGYCGFYEQSKLEPDGRRSSFTTIARSGSRAVRLLTQSGDANVHGSGLWERNDLSLPPSAAYCNQGQEEWWAMSVYFPKEYVVPANSAVMDFHHNASGGQANFHITSSTRGLEVRGFYGDVRNPSEYRTNLGPVVRETWYDFVYHVKWSAGEDGFFVVWMNGKKVLTHEGPTLYRGISCYLKLANYHEPFGGSQSVIFDRVIRGTSADAVSLTPLAL